MSLRLASFFVAFMVPAESQIEPLAIYGDYLIVSSFVDPFWAERSRMGYAYHQRNFNNMAEMLQWSASNHIDWGWKEGSDYGQLFYRQTDTGYNPAFPQSVTAWTLYGSFNPYVSDACGFGKRCFFVKTSALVYHPSWANTWARAAYLKRTQQASAETIAKGEQVAPRDNICSRVRCDCGHPNLGEPCKTCCRSTTQGGTGNETTSLAKAAVPRDDICSRVRCDCGHPNLGEPCKTCCRSTTQGDTGNETTSPTKAAVPRGNICSRVRCDCGHPNLGEPCKTCCRSTTQGDTGNEKLPEIVAASTKAGPETAAKTAPRCACLTPGWPCPVGFWCGSCTACSCPDSNCLPWSQHTCYWPYAASAANASVVLV